MGQMFAHEVNAMKGWPSPYALDKTVELDVATDDVDEVFAGMVGHMSPSASGKFRLGCVAHTAGVAPMPLFVFPNAGDFDVAIDSNSVFGSTGSYQIVGMSSADAPYSEADGAGQAPTQRPVLGCLVAKGPYELSTTEFQGSPTTGMLLTSPTHAVDSTHKGLLTIAWASSKIAKDAVLCGVVSDGVKASDHIGGPDRLNFWPIYLVAGNADWVTGA